MPAFLRTGFTLALLGLALPLAAQTAREFITFAPEQVPFKSPLGVGPQQAVLFGDPSKPGVYVIRVHFPPGFHSNPHFHSQDRHATVIKGVWWNGTGDKVDFKQARPIKAGSYILHPAGGVHWDGAGDEETIIQIIGVGPVATTAVGGPSNPASDNWPKPK